MSKLRVEPGKTCLIVVDVQEKLMPAMEDHLRGRLLKNLARLGEACRVLGVPVIMTEQYRKGLGATLPEVREAFRGADPIDKLTFDACGEPKVLAALEQTRADTVIVAGVETHVCVFQTVRGLLEKKRSVHVLADAVASRAIENFEIGLGLAKDAGASISSTETVLFDLLGAAGTDTFKAISKLVR